MVFAGDRERQARQDAAPVDPHRARAAGTLVASLLGACEIEMFAQRVEQAYSRLDGQLALHPVEPQ
jgi:hypothetical protein